MDGLAFLHNNNQIHRDIKPGNILLNSLGVVKIADFGITKVLDDTVKNTKSFVGTMCYMVRPPFVHVLL
jgi:serine/threonine protein kinase